VLDPELLTGLEDAVEAAPDNRALHFHLIALLLNGGLADRALGHAQWLLLHEPDNREALLFAAQAAEQLDDIERAGRYRRVAEALSGPGPEQMPGRPCPGPEPRPSS
jgi:hypothetical protein